MDLGDTIPDVLVLRPVVFSIFWCGTSGDKDDVNHHVEWLGRACEALDLTDVEGALLDLPDPSDDNKVHLKLRFDGCGVAFGTMGMLWGTGLSSQCDEAYKRVRELVYSKNRFVTLNLYGLSRGAVACLMFCTKLKEFSKTQLSINCLAFDPVPGNFLWSGAIDFFGFSNAWDNMNIKGVAAMNSALCLYPYEPLPDIAAHAPMIPVFDDGIAVYEVILGCHQGAMRMNTNLDSWISAVFTINYLCSHGTRFPTHQYGRPFVFGDYFRLGNLLGELDRESEVNASSTRRTHSYGSLKVLRTPGRPFLNKLHYILSQLHDEGRKHEFEDWQNAPYFFDAVALAEDVQYCLHLSAKPVKKSLLSFACSSSSLE